MHYDCADGAAPAHAAPIRLGVLKGRQTLGLVAADAPAVLHGAGRLSL